MGHSCRICGRIRANEKFSGKGHAQHVCKDCAREQRTRLRARRKAARTARNQPKESTAMHEKNAVLREEARELIARFYERFPNPNLEERAGRAVRFLLSDDMARDGKAGGWAGGIVYALGAWRTPKAGMPDALMSEMTQLFGVSRTTIHERAKIALRELDVLPKYTLEEIAEILRDVEGEVTAGDGE